MVCETEIDSYKTTKNIVIHKREDSRVKTYPRERISTSRMMLNASHCPSISALKTC